MPMITRNRLSKGVATQPSYAYRIMVISLILSAWPNCLAQAKKQSRYFIHQQNVVTVNDYDPSEVFEFDLDHYTRGRSQVDFDFTNLTENCFVESQRTTYQETTERKLIQKDHYFKMKSFTADD